MNIVKKIRNMDPMTKTFAVTATAQVALAATVLVLNHYARKNAES